MRRLAPPVAVLLALAAAPAAAQASPAPPPRTDQLTKTDVDQRYTGKFPQYRIPALATTTAGTTIAAYDGRPDMRDLPAPMSVIIRRSADGGRTWGPQQIVRNGPAPQGYGDPSLIIDRETGRIFLFYAASINRGYGNAAPGNDPSDPNILHPDYSYSDDDGRTWQHRRLTQEIKDPSWQGMFAASGAGIQLRHGRYAGRLIQQYTVRIRGGNYAVSAYSDDHGQTWHTGEPVGPGADENKTVELSDGTIMLNSRAKPRRLVAYSRDGGQTWTDFQPDPALIDPANNGSILRYAPDATPDDPQAKWLLFSNTADDEIRRNLTVRMSCDDGQTWPIRRTVEEASSAYSTLSHLPGGDIGMLYERSGYQRMTMARFDLTWLNGTCVPLTLTTPTSLAAGSSATVRVDLVNQNSTAVAPGFVSLDVPDGWQSSTVKVGRLASGERAHVEVTITLPDNIAPRNYQLTAQYRTGPSWSYSTPTPVNVTGEVTAERPGLRIEPVLDNLAVAGSPGILDDSATYWTKFTNTGNVPLANITVSGNMTGLGSCAFSRLAPGASYVCRATRHTVSLADARAGSFVPALQASATTLSGMPFRASGAGEVLPVDQSPPVVVAGLPAVQPAASVDAVAPLTVRVPLVNASTQPHQALVSLSGLGHWTADAATAEVTVPAGGTAEATFTVTPNGQSGWTTAVATVSVGGEPVAASIVDLVSGGRHISDWPWVTQSNGWGPVERDQSNGEQASDDGRMLTLRGRSYLKGVGVHARSEIQLNLGRNCTRFQSDVGVDDEVTGGSVRFRVLGDGVTLWQSPVLTRSSSSLRADVNITGVDDLRLIVDDSGDGNGQDHADWAGAWLQCAG